MITRNAIRCLSCDTVIESAHVHDFRRCPCSKVYVDGGREYLRRGWPEGDPHDHYEELSTTDDKS